MNMFCFQCQETARNSGCTVKGVCGKEAETANLQDLLIYSLKGIAGLWQKATARGIALAGYQKQTDLLILESLFATITNANFDTVFFVRQIEAVLALKQELLHEVQAAGKELSLMDAELWTATGKDAFLAKAVTIGIPNQPDEDLKSLQELVIYGIKGIAAYAHHAHVLGYEDEAVHSFIKQGLAATLDPARKAEDFLQLVLDCGGCGVKAMALLDKANTETYGHPEPTTVELGVRSNPGILISGHDLKDLAELLEQSAGQGIDIYTHGEMLPAHYYPAFKKYSHFAGNYGGSWWKQGEEFEKFGGPVLMTTNCLVTPRATYSDRLYTTGVVSFPGLAHIPDRQPGQAKDFSALIARAKICPPPVELETGQLTGGFAHNAVLGLADKVVAAVKAGKLRKFVVMAGCDGRHKSREYYTGFAEALPRDTVILTAGCAKYRYNKLQLGDIDGIPRVLDAGQCNDSYSLAVIALKLAEVFGVELNQLPLVFNIAWYEQKAVIVLLALLYLGVKNIHVGPTLPAFLSPGVVSILVEKFGIAGVGEIDADIELLVGA